MKAALEEAKKGFAEGGIPIGSILVKDGQIVGRGHNRRVQQNDPIMHAEIDCLRNAGRIGKYAKEPFDMTQRSFFLRFNTENKEERVQAFRELCKQLNISAEKYLS